RQLEIEAYPVPRSPTELVYEYTVPERLAGDPEAPESLVLRVIASDRPFAGDPHFSAPFEVVVQLLDDAAPTLTAFAPVAGEARVIEGQTLSLEAQAQD